MRTVLVCVLFVAMIAMMNAYPASELEANNQVLFDTNAEGVEHDAAQRQVRQFGFGRYGGYGGFGGFRGGYGGFGGGFGGFGGFRGGYGGYGGYYG